MQKIQGRATRTPLKTKGELNSCSTSGTSGVTLVRNLVISHERGNKDWTGTTTRNNISVAANHVMMTST